MILAANRRLLLSGNRWLLLAALMLAAGCYPRRAIYTPGSKENTGTVTRTRGTTGTTTPKNTDAAVKNMALLLPFKLDELQSSTANNRQVQERKLAINFYRGFLMGVDSAVAKGAALQITTLDTRDNGAQVTSLMRGSKIRNQQLIVGPVFPEGLQAITSYSRQQDIPVVSPLAATDPEQFGNDNLISLTPNIKLHAAALAQYLSKWATKNTQIVLINRQTVDDSVYGNALVDAFTKAGIEYKQYASVYELERALTPGARYTVIVCAYGADFVNGTIKKLAQMQAKDARQPYSLIGHPNWSKLNLPQQLLLDLRAVTTTSYYIDYSRRTVQSFTRNYLRRYKQDADEYAFKGYDAGSYFATLLNNNQGNIIRTAEATPYNGLHNNFRFVRVNGQGLVNTSVKLLKYSQNGWRPVL